MADAEYGPRYCAFVDILGFGELVAKLDGGVTPLDALRGLLSKIHNPPTVNAAASPRADFRAQSISDAVALSAACNPAGLGAVIHSINQLAVDLLQQGFFIRGAIVKDALYHDEKTVFGKALIRAYQLESAVVKFPRVMVTHEVVDDVRAIDQKTYDLLLRRADDGPMFVHVLRAIEVSVLPLVLGRSDTVHSKIDSPKFKDRLIRYGGIADQIQRRFDEAADNPNHFEKVKWFANYWNATVDRWDIYGLERT